MDTRARRAGFELHEQLAGHRFDWGSGHSAVIFSRRWSVTVGGRAAAIGQRALIRVAGRGRMRIRRCRATRAATNDRECREYSCECAERRASASRRHLYILSLFLRWARVICQRLRLIPKRQAARSLCDITNGNPLFSWPYRQPSELTTMSRTLRLPYAPRACQVVGIADVESGLRRDCSCPVCGHELVAKKGNKVS